MDHFPSFIYNGMEFENNVNPSHPREIERRFNMFRRHMQMLNGRGREDLYQDFFRNIGLNFNYAGGAETDETSQSATTDFFLINFSQSEVGRHSQNNQSTNNGISHDLNSTPNLPNNSSATRVAHPQNPGVNHEYDLNGRNMLICRVPNSDYYIIVIAGRTHQDRMRHLNEAASELNLITNRSTVTTNDRLPGSQSVEDQISSSTQNVQQSNNSGLCLI